MDKTFVLEAKSGADDFVAKSLGDALVRVLEDIGVLLNTPKTNQLKTTADNHICITVIKINDPDQDEVLADFSLYELTNPKEGY